MTENETFLLGLLRENGFRRGNFTLSSGKQSDFFIDCKKIALSAIGHNYIGRVLYDRLHNNIDVDAVAGVELGGCPLASAVSMYSLDEDITVDALYVRKTVKEHGTKATVEGMFKKGDTVLLLEDVVTTGGSSLRAVETLREAGLIVCGVLALVDRSEGGKETIDKVVPFTSIFTRVNFM